MTSSRTFANRSTQRRLVGGASLIAGVCVGLGWLAVPAVALSPAAPGFQLTGTAVRGSTGSATPPVLQAGSWTDTLPATAQKLRYTIKRTPGATLFISATSVVGQVPGGAANDSSSVGITAPDGSTCESGIGTGSSAGGQTELMVASVVVEGPDPAEAAADQDPCTGPELTLSVNRGTGSSLPTGAQPTPLQLLVSERSAATDPDSQPAPAASPAAAALPASGTPRTGEGGRSFAAATEADANGVRGTLRPGDLLVYKVRVDWGQRPVFRVDLGGSTATDDQIGSGGGQVDIRLLGPDHETLDGSAADYRMTYDSLHQLNYQGAPATGSVTGAQVRYRNTDTSSLTGAAQAGDYYLVVNLNRADSASGTYSVPITVRAAAAGQAEADPANGSTAATEGDAGTASDGSTAPASGGSTAPPTGGTASDAGSGQPQDASDSRDDGELGSTAKAALGAGGLVVVTGLVVLALLLLRRPRDDG